jgi:hypothetical protein
MSNNNITAVSVFEVILNNPNLSATGISRECGYSKKSAIVAECIDILYNDDFITETQVSNFFVYNAAAGITLEAVTAKYEPTPVVAPAASDVDPGMDRINNPKVEEWDMPSNLNGYSILVTDIGFDVTFPDGTVHTIDRHERIIVINKTKHVAVTTPEGMLQAIHNYVEAKGWAHYVVTDVTTGQSITPKSVNLRPVLIFLGIERHNKAGI